MERREALKRTVKLAGSTAVAPSLWSILQSCKKQSRLDWNPVFLNEDQARFISSLVNVFLPKTDTPGALEMKVDIFIDKVFDTLYEDTAKAHVAAEIDKFNAACKDRFGDVFADLSDGDRTEVLKEAERSSGKFNGKVWGTAVSPQEPVGFYRDLKSLALWAYFTSQEVGENILSYDPVPGDYLGCIPLSEVGNTWSL